MQKRLFALFIVSLFRIAALGTDPLAVPLLTINGSASGTFSKKEPWTLALSGAPTEAIFDLCVKRPVDPVSCAPNFGKTDSKGTWTGLGHFEDNSIGAWTQWARFPKGLISSRISILVDNLTSIRLSINGKDGGTFGVGQSWVRSLASDYPNTPFSVCTTRDEGLSNCTGFDAHKTDSTGAFTVRGSFGNAEVGVWREWVRFPNEEVSNTLAFTVGSDAPPRLAINGTDSGRFVLGQDWRLSLSASPPNTPFELCTVVNGEPTSCVPDFGRSDSSGSWELPGMFHESALGSWSLVARFPSGRNSDWLSFAVGFPHYRTFALDFGPYMEEQDPNTRVVISEDQIRKRLSIIASFTNGVRSYGATNGLEHIARIAREEFGLQTYIGAWIDKDQRANNSEISSLIRLMRQGYVSLGIVGSEVLYRNDLDETALIRHINTVRMGAPGIPVATSDTAVRLLRHTRVGESGDVVLANVHPFWEGHDVGVATASPHFVFLNLRERYPGKEIVISETGWPSRGQTVGKAVPSPQNAATYFLNFTSWARAFNVKYFYFEALDEAWKVAIEGPAGANWGTFDQHGSLKPGMIEVFSGKAAPDTWSRDVLEPTTPKSLRASPLSWSTIDLQWEASTDNATVVGYKVYRQRMEIGTTGTTNYRDTGLSAVTDYSYAVAAYDAVGNISERSSSVSVKTQALPRDTVAPIAPTGVTATAISATQINLSWTAAVDRAQAGAIPSGIASYEIHRSSQGNTSMLATTGGSVVTYGDRSVFPDTTYSYLLRAVDHDGNRSVNSNSARATTPCRADPIDGTGTPSIQFTTVPPIRTSQNLEGRVSHVSQPDYYVAVFIYVPGYGWVTKPQWGAPRTRIECDGSWASDITTGGSDSSATRIVAYLFRSSYRVPVLGDYTRGAPVLPGELELNAVAKVSINR